MSPVSGSMMPPPPDSSQPVDPGFDWENLLVLIEMQQVVPVVGRELLTADDGKLDRLLAERTLAELKVPGEGLREGFGLADVASRYIQRGGPMARQMLYPRLAKIVQSAELPVPEPLKKLAQIGDFSVFVSSTFDSLLAQAIDSERQEAAIRGAFSCHGGWKDLANLDLSKLSVPFIFQVFGSADSGVDYAVTEEDCLEYLHQLQTEKHTPPDLIHELRQRNLLFIGCGFSDWLTRFFIRTFTSERLSKMANYVCIADSQAAGDERLAEFLGEFGTVARSTAGAVEFVDMLHAQWTERNAGAAGEEARAAAEASDMAGGAVFLSYASEDRESVETMRNALESVGIEVWFDKRELQAGDAWDRMIRTNIQRCSLFLPVISRSAERRDEGYFRREWRWAIDRAEGMAETRKFILPVVVDDTPDNAEAIPAPFWARQAQKCPSGSLDDAFVKRIVEIVRELRAKEKGL